MQYKFIYIHKATGKKVMTDHKLNEEEFELVSEIKTVNVKQQEFYAK